MSADKHTSPHPDLEALRRTEPAYVAARRPWLPRLTMVAILLGLLGAAYAVLRPVLFPPRIVAISPIRAVTSGEGATRSSAFVTAAGWVEAYPFPSTVRPLVKGVVETMQVLEGTPVTKDETVIARLRNADIENAVPVARQALALREAERSQAETALRVARSLLEQKIPLRVEVAQHEGELATARAAVDRARAQRAAGEAALATAQVDLDAQLELERAGHATPSALARAKARMREAEERVSALAQAEAFAASEVKRHADLLALAREAVLEPRDLQGHVDAAEALLARAGAAVGLARADLDVAETNAALLVVKAPITGVVLRLESAPGALVGPQGAFKGAGEGAGSTGLLNRLTGTLCSLYDPQQLQVRVDVPYDDLPGIVKGTAVEIEARALPGKTLKGVVDRVVREADITQAKLQIKVRLENPDEGLRPEMLCTARFVVKSAAAGSGSKGVHRVQVPTEAIREDAVFVYDPTGGGKARRVPVRVVRRAGDWTDVEGDLGLASKVILDAVEDGERVEIKQ